jgi:hypothetical protein
MASEQENIPPTATPQTALHPEDEIIHVPEGKNRTRWIMLILLLILTLTTFTVGDQLVNAVSGERRSDTYMTWKHPEDGIQKVSPEEYGTLMRSINMVYGMLGSELRDEQVREVTTGTIIFSALGERAGIGFTDAELGNFILNRFGNKANYDAILKGYRMQVKEFESTLRRILIAERYKTLLANTFDTPDPAEIEKSWKTQHVEHAFDYIELPVANVLGEAKTIPLSDEELQLYFDGLPQPRKDSFRTAEKISADVVGIPYDMGLNPELLFAKYPKAVDPAVLEAKGRQFYDNFRFSRYRKDRLDTDKPPTGEADLVKAFDDVKAQAIHDGAIYESLLAWIKDMQSRLLAGEKVDMDQESQVLGLGFRRVDPVIDQASWNAIQNHEFISYYTPSSLFNGGPDVAAGKLYSAPILDEKAFTVVKVLAKEEPALPPFDQLRDKLKEEVWNSKAKDLAKSKLEALRDQFGTRPTPVEGQPAPSFFPQAEEPRFYEVARGASLEAKLRDYKERFPTGTETPAPVDTFLRSQPAAYTEAAGTVLPAAVDFEGKSGYLVRVRGSRDPDVVRMKPADVAMLTSTAKMTAASDFQKAAFGELAMAARFGVTYTESKNPDGN